MDIGTFTILALVPLASIPDGTVCEVKANYDQVCTVKDKGKFYCFKHNGMCLEIPDTKKNLEDKDIFPAKYM